MTGIAAKQKRNPRETIFWVCRVAIRGKMGKKTGCAKKPGGKRVSRARKKKKKTNEIHHYMQGEKRNELIV